MSAKKLITWEEVAKHNTPKEVWLVIEGEVYDTTPYLDDHPGGPTVMQSRAGRDATRDFNETGHTGNARNKMKIFHLGSIDPESKALDWQKGAGGAGLDTKQLVILISAFLVVASLWFFFKT